MICFKDVLVNPSPRILITRLSHIGDCILTMPLLAAIREQYPHAFIAWAVESPSHKLLELHPLLDEIVVIPKGWMGKRKCWSELRQTFKRLKFDIAIDPQGITKSAALGWISGAKKRIGIRGRWGREFSPWLNNCLVETKSQHLVDRSLELLSEIGIKASNIDYGLLLCEKSTTSVEHALARIDSQGRLKHGFCLINPGAGWRSRRWENDRFGSVASYLKRHHGVTSLVVWAGDEELEMAQEIVAFDKDASVLAPKTDLRELAVLCQRASFYLGGDTGPMHLASAMGTPCIGLHGTTLPTESGAHGAGHISVQKWHQSGNRRKCENDAMRDILAADVFLACDEMLCRLGLKQAS